MRSDDFNLFSVNPGSWETTGSKPISDENKQDSTDTIHHLLLSASNLENAWILVGKERRQTRRIGFRDIAHLTFVNEKRIIDDLEPVYPIGQRDSLTGELATFSYLISGSDWKGVIAAPDTKVLRATWRGKNELYVQLIQELEAEVGENPPSIGRLTEQIADCDARIIEVNSKIEESGRIIATMMGSRRQNWEEAQRARTRLAVIGQLQDRFKSLLEHYQSDIERLRFIVEVSAR